MGRNEGGAGGTSSSKALGVGQKFPSRKELGLEIKPKNMSAQEYEAQINAGLSNPYGRNPPSLGRLEARQEASLQQINRMNQWQRGTNAQRDALTSTARITANAAITRANRDYGQALIYHENARLYGGLGQFAKYAEAARTAQEKWDRFSNTATVWERLIANPDNRRP